jgi:hypothetical protein
LIDGRDVPFRALRRLFIQRALRIGLLVAVIAGVLLVSVRLLSPKNLAAGSSWSTSSSLYRCYPEKRECGGVQTRILFHTREENDPWFEYDLGKPTRFSSVTIRNRSDYSDRAVPLVLEISNNQRSYEEIARQAQTFDVWKPKFHTKEARYVRLRVARHSFLHLESVEVYP